MTNNYSTPNVFYYRAFVVQLLLQPPQITYTYSYIRIKNNVYLYLFKLIKLMAVSSYTSIKR